MHARNMEFVRDKGALFWNLIFPVFLVFVFSFAFSGRDEALFKVGVIGELSTEDTFSSQSFVEVIPYQDVEEAFNRIRHHQIDMLIDFREGEYYINDDSPKGDAAESMLLNSDISSFNRQSVSGKPIRYVDWFVPGVIGMNMMFSCIFGVGWIIVRYRKNGVLKRLKATPVKALEFVSAQLVSRLYIVLTTAIIVYAGCNLFLNFMMEGSYLNLIFLTAVATVCMIAFGLIFAARIKSEELASGVMNLALWPMMVFSGIFFSLEGTPPILQKISRIFPLTHYLEGARAIMLDGAGMVDIMPNFQALIAMLLLFLVVTSLIFKWE